jgi:hypothetical protein
MMFTRRFTLAGNARDKKIIKNRNCRYYCSSALARVLRKIQKGNY